MRKLGIISLTAWLVGLVAIILVIMFNLWTLGDGVQILIMYTLVIVTVHYAASTHKMVKEMEAESATRRPYLNLDNWRMPEHGNPKRWQVDLRNFGNIPAYAVELEAKPIPSGCKEMPTIDFTGASALIMPGQCNRWAIDLGSALEPTPSQSTKLEIEFVIRYRNAPTKPSKIWELRLVRKPDPAIRNWDLVGEDSEVEKIITK